VLALSLAALAQGASAESFLRSKDVFPSWRFEGGPLAQPKSGDGDEFPDTANGAPTLAPNSVTPARFNDANDIDYVRFEFPAAGTWVITTTGDRDTIGAIFASDGVTQLAANDDPASGGLNFRIVFHVPRAGSYFVGIAEFNQEVGTYTIVSTFSDSLTALWWNPAESGWGINLNHQGDILFATLFTYDSTGRDYWLVASAMRRQPDGSFRGDLYETTGPVHTTNPWTPATVTVTTVGTMSVELESFERARLVYNVHNVTVTKQIERQVFSSPPLCRLSAASRQGTTNFTDLWWNPAESGWGINLTHQADTIFATLFTYDDDRRPMWLVASNVQRQSDGSFRGDLFRLRGPAFDAQPWSAPTLSTVGSLALIFTDGEHGVLTYNVGTATVVRQITRQLFGSPPTLCTQ
jgi:hypothetical protein